MLTRRLRSVVLLAVVLVGAFAVSALASAGKAVNVADNYYGPKTLTVGRGAKVTWKWTGVLKHNVVVHTGPSSFSSKTQVRGSFSHTFTKKGTYQLVCTVHPKMKMTVVVK